MGYGKVYLVGTGPGDPKLLTLRALEVLQQADIVIYDRLVSDKVLRLVPEGAEKVYVGKAPGRHTFTQENINEFMIQAALNGKTVVRLKSGDPFVFGRGGEETEALASRGIEFEVVPGISSALAVPAYAGISLTHRAYASSVAIVTGSQAETSKRVNWEKLAGVVDTIVVLMGLRSLRNIAEGLMNGGLSPDTPVAVIEKGTTEEQKTLIGRLATIAEDVERMALKPPSVIVIGEVVKLGKKLAWFKKPLV
jgi:uroporphyrinogen III methyltransferase/synthase